MIEIEITSGMYTGLPAFLVESLAHCGEGNETNWAVDVIRPDGSVAELAYETHEFIEKPHGIKVHYHVIDRNGFHQNNVWTKEKDGLYSHTGSVYAMSDAWMSPCAKQGHHTF